MSIHPNVILLLILKPDDLARKTYREIMLGLGYKEDTDYIKINDEKYHAHIMESDYYEPSQISAPEGSLIFWDLVTYGYGETIKWDELEKQKNDLEKWAGQICEQHKCSYEIVIGANYW